jgi:hypothetical protein
MGLTLFITTNHVTAGYIKERQKRVLATADEKDSISTEP